MQKDKNNLFIISGPSGAGEDSIINGLKKILPIESIITTTTRKMRPGEKQKFPYYFITREKFKKGIKKNKFFEYALEYNNNYYGVTKQEIQRVRNSNKIGIWKIEYKGVITAKKLMPNITAILITAPMNVLKKRIKSRSRVSEKYLKERMEYTGLWQKHYNIYDYKIVNKENKLDTAIHETAKIILENLKK